MALRLGLAFGWRAERAQALENEGTCLGIFPRCGDCRVELQSCTTTRRDGFRRKRQPGRSLQVSKGGQLQHDCFELFFKDHQVAVETGTRRLWYSSAVTKFSIPQFTLFGVYSRINCLPCLGKTRGSTSKQGDIPTNPCESTFSHLLGLSSVRLWFGFVFK